MEHKPSLSRQDVLVTLVGFVLVVSVIVFFGAKHLISRSPSVHDTQETTQKSSLSEVPSIAAETALQKFISSDELAILDLRNISEYAAFHIPDAVSVTLDDISKLPLTPGDEVIIVASDDEVAQAASDILTRREIVHFSIRGGLPAWEAASGMIVHYGDPTSATDQSKVTLVTPDEFSTLLSDPERRYRLLDVRASSKTVAEKAMHIPLAEIESRRDEIPPATPIAVCGENGVEAFQAAVRLFDLGFPSVKTLDGGCESINPTSEEKSVQ